MSYLRDLFSTWINKFRKKNKLRYEIDWQLSEWFDEDGEAVSCIKILTGQFKNIVYRYTYVKILEDHENNTAVVKYGYDIITKDIQIHALDEFYLVMHEILEFLIEDKQGLGEYVLPSQHYGENMNAET